MFIEEYVALQKSLTDTLQDAATTGSGSAIYVGINGSTTIREHTFYIVGSSGVSAGAIQIETAHDPVYAGTWAPLGDPVTIIADTITAVQITGALQVVRARVSTTVTGGTVSVHYVGN